MEPRLIFIATAYTDKYVLVVFRVAPAVERLSLLGHLCLWLAFRADGLSS